MNNCWIYQYEICQRSSLQQEEIKSDRQIICGTDNCRKLKSNNLISNRFTVNSTVHLISDNIKNGKPVKVLHMKSLIYLFLDFKFDVRNNESDDANNLAVVSYQSSY